MKKRAVANALLTKYSQELDCVFRHLSKLKIVKGYNGLTFKDNCIKTSEGEYRFVKDASVTETWLAIRDNYLLQFIDDSVIGFKLDYDKSLHAIRKVVYVFCSCPYFKEDIRYQDFENDEQIKNLFSEYRTSLLAYGAKEHIIGSMLSLKKIPTYFRCDYDLDGEKDSHPLVHLSISGIEESRFRVNNLPTLTEFVDFVLDIAFGIKTQKSPQQLMMHFE